MLYNCPCDQRVIDIPTKMFLVVSDDEIDRMCIEGFGCQVNNPFYGSFVESQGVILTPEEVEERNDAEYEAEEDPINADLNLPPDHWE